ncbi:glycosyltransferase involved in cell wall biosynthesis [Pelomonas saccharophila]|uniref:Glycosyltransferase involved in cell wall biosynthesis n=1 Tax=Roseateles saccharophilus TaxID=304 RepID=A0ABU1YIW1_ROSSA|nr:glycosyltransferase [Roseateles saccharophilus]MDR7268787.1 glycosyltransferase involved in cell wall biosynthesis [Roseateles saccharophilus]
MPPPFEPLTLVHVVFSSRIAGGERHCIDLANAQAALGHRVHVIGSAGSAVSGALASGVGFHGLKLPLLRGWRVAALARRLGADICHGHLGPACKAVAHARSAARIGTLHVGYKAHHHARLDGLVCVNRAQHESLPQGGALASVIYNWAPERDAAAAARHTDLRAELGLAPQQLLVGSVGRLHRSKGMDLLIAGFKAHAPADAVLAILGEGPDEAALKELAAGDARVRLLGFRGDVDQCLKSFDLFVSPSREEAFPLAILEAMRAGRPVLSSATQGPQEMLAGQPARLVPVGDAHALGHAIAEELGRLRPLLPQQRSVAYATAAYDRSNAVARTLGFYRDVMLHQAAQAKGFDSEEEAYAAWHV